MHRYALVVIDMQRGFLDASSPLFIPGAADTVPACARAIDCCHRAGVPVVFAVRHYRADGSDVERARYDVWARGGRPLSETCPPSMSDAWPEEFHRADTDYVIVKPRFSAFFHTELDLILRRLGVDTVLLAGTTTPQQGTTSPGKVPGSILDIVGGDGSNADLITEIFLSTFPRRERPLKI